MLNSRLHSALKVAATATLLVMLAACTGPEAQALRFGEAVWDPGETSVYRITDLNGDFAGTARYDLRAIDEGWRMERLTQTQGDEERLSVDMAAQGFRPRASTLVRSDSEGVERVNAGYEQGEVHLDLTTKADVTTTEVVNVPSDSRDPRALFMLVRTLPLQTGYSTKVNTYQPVTSRMTRTTVTILGDEPIETPAGTFDAWLLVLDEGDRQSRAWIAKEPPHMLVKYVDAANGGTFDLSEYSPGD